MFAKINVNGGSASPLWTFLKEKQAGFLINAIKWNFTKFLINREGKPVARWGGKRSYIYISEIQTSFSGSGPMTV